MGTQISKAGAQAAQAAALKEQMEKRSEALKEASQRSTARLQARDKRNADMGERLRQEGIETQRESKAARRAEQGARYAEAQANQAAYRQHVERLAKAADGVSNKFDQNSTANKANVRNEIAQQYEAANAAQEQREQASDGEGPADEVLRMYGYDDPLKVIEYFNAEKDRLKDARVDAINRQIATTENAKKERLKQNAMYEAEVKAVEKERLIGEGERLLEENAKTDERARKFRALRQKAQARNNEFADRREETITAGEKASDFKRMVVFEKRREELRATAKRDAQATFDAQSQEAASKMFRRSQASRTQANDKAEAIRNAETDRMEAERATERRPVVNDVEQPLEEVRAQRRVQAVREQSATEETRSLERQAVAEALNTERALSAANTQRAKALAKQAELTGEEASRESQEVAKSKLKPARETASVVLNQAEARDAADEAARFTIDNPAEAVAAQPYLSVQAVLRVLS
ncbi:MAG: hypothetical protein VX589_00630 [Myxococcota bacterium]|nr:hypothetical protein [Myxococcota bacterium]